VRLARERVDEERDAVVLGARGLGHPLLHRRAELRDDRPGEQQCCAPRHCVERYGGVLNTYGGVLNVRWRVEHYGGVLKTTMAGGCMRHLFDGHLLGDEKLLLVQGLPQPRAVSTVHTATYGFERKIKRS
jgi:hypothetical protein